MPAGVVHQTITHGETRLVYFLFNAFLGADKEGHASFADHIAKVKETRRQQAAVQRADADPAVATGSPSGRPGRCIDTAKLGAEATTILSRNETERCEAVHHRLGAGIRLTLEADGAKEQTFYIISGSGRFMAGRERADVAGGQVVFLPRQTAGLIEAGESGLQLISFGTVMPQ